MFEPKWTEGPWWLDDDHNIAAGSDDTYKTIADPRCMPPDGNEDEIDANADLMVAAPNGFEAASVAYLAILQSPHNRWRVECGLDGTLSMLRDYIAKATNRTSQEVQEEYEAEAARLLSKKFS